MLSVLTLMGAWVKGFNKILCHFLSGPVNGPLSGAATTSAGSAVLLGGMVKGANSLFSNIRGMSSKVMQSVAG